MQPTSTISALFESKVWLTQSRFCKVSNTNSQNSKLALLGSQKIFAKSGFINSKVSEIWATEHHLWVDFPSFHFVSNWSQTSSKIFKQELYECKLWFHFKFVLWFVNLVFNLGEGIFRCVSTVKSSSHPKWWEDKKKCKVGAGNEGLYPCWGTKY